MVQGKGRLRPACGRGQAAVKHPFKCLISRRWSLLTMGLMVHSDQIDRAVYHTNDRIILYTMMLANGYASNPANPENSASKVPAQKSEPAYRQMESPQNTSFARFD